MNYEWQAKEKPPTSWADWFSNLHDRCTTWLGVFLLCFIGVPANVTMWWVFVWVFPHPTFLGIIVFIWLGIISCAWAGYTLWCLLEAAFGD